MSSKLSDTLTECLLLSMQSRFSGVGISLLYKKVYNFHIYICKLGFINIYFIVQVKQNAICYSICYPNVPNFGHWELFQVGSLVPLISPNLGALSYFLTSSVSSVAQSCLTLRPHEPQHARSSCPSPTPGVHQNPCPLNR